MKERVKRLILNKGNLDLEPEGKGWNYKGVLQEGIIWHSTTTPRRFWPKQINKWRQISVTWSLGYIPLYLSHSCLKSGCYQIQPAATGWRERWSVFACAQMSVCWVNIVDVKKNPREQLPEEHHTNDVNLVKCRRGETCNYSGRRGNLTCSLEKLMYLFYLIATHVNQRPQSSSEMVCSISLETAQTGTANRKQR